MASTTFPKKELNCNAKNMIRLILLAFFFPLVSFAQTVDGKEIDQLPTYISFTLYNKAFSKKNLVFVSPGTEFEKDGYKYSVLKDNQGNEFRPSSVIDLLNVFAKRGYRLKLTYLSSLHYVSTEKATWYLLEKK